MDWAEKEAVGSASVFMKMMKKIRLKPSGE
jgi:hypothetical protein